MYTVCWGYLLVMRAILVVGSVSFCIRTICGFVSWRICSRSVISCVGIFAVWVCCDSTYMDVCFCLSMEDV